MDYHSHYLCPLLAMLLVLAVTHPPAFSWEISGCSDTVDVARL